MRWRSPIATAGRATGFVRMLGDNAGFGAAGKGGAGSASRRAVPYRPHRFDRAVFDGRPVIGNRLARKRRFAAFAGTSAACDERRSNVAPAIERSDHEAPRRGLREAALRRFGEAIPCLAAADTSRSLWRGRSLELHAGAR